MSNLVSATHHFSDLAYHAVRMYAAIAHPYIRWPLFYCAAVACGVSSVGCAVFGKKEERFAFAALAGAFFLMALSNLYIGHAVYNSALPNPQAAFEAAVNDLTQLRLSLSKCANIALISFTILFALRCQFNRSNLSIIARAAITIGPVCVSAGLVYGLGLANEIANDEVVSTLAFAVAGAGLTMWARQYGILAMTAMALFCVVVTIPQFDYWKNRDLYLDAMRLAALGIAILLSWPAILAKAAKAGLSA